MSQPDPTIEILQAAASMVAARHGFPEPGRLLVPVNDRPCEAVMFRFSDSTHLYLLAHPWFPELPPFVVVRWGDSEDPTRQVPVSWERHGEIADRLDAALAAFVAPGGTLSPRLGFDPRMPIAEADADPGL